MQRHCYFIPADQNPKKTGGYVPAVVFEGKSGYSMMTGRGEFSAPWVWGKTLDEAEKTADSYNTNRLDLTSSDVMDIISSSMR